MIMIVINIALAAGLLCVAALIVRSIYQGVPRYAPLQHFKHGRRIGTRTGGKSDCVWIPPNNK